MGYFECTSNNIEPFTHREQKKVSLGTNHKSTTITIPDYNGLPVRGLLILQIRDDGGKSGCISWRDYRIKQRIFLSVNAGTMTESSIPESQWYIEDTEIIRYVGPNDIAGEASFILASIGLNASYSAYIEFYY